MRRGVGVDAEALVRPVVEAAGLELVELSFGREGGRRLLRVIVDREGGADLDTLSQLSERISRRLDLEGFDPATPYTLEVSSPGIERRLREPAHFRRAIGQQVKVKTFAPVEGARTHEGALLTVDDDAITVEVPAGTVRIPFEAVASARTVVDWHEELARSRQ
jgi:ribosome maturation factor RimP